MKAAIELLDLALLLPVINEAADETFGSFDYDFDQGNNKIVFYDEIDNKIEFDIVTLETTAYDMYGHELYKLSLDEVFSTYSELVGKEIPMEDGTIAKISFDGAVTIEDQAAGLVTSVDLNSMYLITRDLDGNFLTEKPLTYAEILDFMGAADAMIEESSYQKEELDPLADVNYEEDEFTKTVTIWEDDGTYIKIKTDTLESTLYDVDGVPSAPVKLVALLGEQIPQELWNIPFPISNTEYAKIIDDVSIEIEDFEHETMTQVDLLKRNFTVTNSDGDLLETEALTWDLVYTFIV